MAKQSPLAGVGEQGPAAEYEDPGILADDSSEGEDVSGDNTSCYSDGEPCELRSNDSTIGIVAVEQLAASCSDMLMPCSLRRCLSKLPECSMLY